MKGIILAAGLGTRLRPLTNHIPKSLVPVLNTPLIRYGIELFKSHGIHEIAINTHHLGEQLEEYLRKIDDIKIHISHEKNILGTFGGIRKMWDLLGDEDVVTMNSDIITSLDISLLKKIHEEKKSLVTIGLISKERDGSYSSVWSDDDGKIISIGGEEVSSTSKPYIFCGIQILGAAVKGWLNFGEAGELIPLVHQRALSENLPFWGYLSQETWLDCGEPAHLLNTNSELLRMFSENDPYFSQLIEKLNPSIQQLSSGIWVGRGATIESTVELVPPIIIGASSVIEGDSIIGPHVSIGDNAHLSNIGEISNSIVLSDSKVSNSTFRDTIVSQQDIIRG